MKRQFALVAVAGLMVSQLVASPADAADDRNRNFGYKGIGPRVGISINPDQFVFGGHVDFGEAFPHVRFQPNIEIGLGDDVTVFQADADFHYRFLESWDVWNPYLGGGLGIISYSADGSSSSDFQIHAVGGIEKYIGSGKFFFETKLGVIDESPDLKIIAGWTFVN